MILNEAAQLTPSEVRALALEYRRWSSVLTAPLASISRQHVAEVGPLAGAIQRALARDPYLVSPCDLEDAAMAVWLYALADAVAPGGSDPVVDLLREPWRLSQTGGRNALAGAV